MIRPKSITETKKTMSEDTRKSEIHAREAQTGKLPISIAEADAIVAEHNKFPDAVPLITRSEYIAAWGN